jgi:regulator of protease activity HflC (stomatin/prohibitin superfamily)
MWLFGLVFALTLGGIIVVVRAFSERIDAGYEGILVNDFGSNRGVDDISIRTGRVWFNPFTQSIHKFPLFIQHKVWTAGSTEGSPNNEEICITTSDGMNICFDVELNFRVRAGQAPYIFSKYRKPMSEITNEALRTLIRSSYVTVASGKNAEELIEKRNEYEKEVSKMVIEKLTKEGFEVQQVNIAGKLRYAQMLQTAIEKKLEASILAQQRQAEIQQKKAQFVKDSIEAASVANRLKIQADAERYANDKRAQSLNPLLIQQQFIEKWDGKLPQYGQPPVIMQDITRNR